MGQLFILRHPETDDRHEIIESKIPTYKSLVLALKDIAGDDSIHVFSSPAQRAMRGAELFTNLENITQIDFLWTAKNYEPRILQIDKDTELGTLADKFYRSFPKSEKLGIQLEDSLKPYVEDFASNADWSINLKEGIYFSPHIMDIKVEDNLVEIPISFKYEPTSEGKKYANALFSYLMDTYPFSAIITHFELVYDVEKLFDKPLFKYDPFFNRAYHIISSDKIDIIRG